MDLKQYNVWFVTGSQHLYGEETLKQVAENSAAIVGHLNESGKIAINVVWKPTVTTPDEITKLAQDANYDEDCIGLICWMHTFSPAKMWINGLGILNKPFMHLHTQFNQDLPWSDIDMDFMNLNQSAHGGREFGFIGSRLRIDRKVVVGYWKDKSVQKKVDTWCRAACGWADSRTMKIARIGDNMREVAVTEGNKVSAQITFGYAVNGYGIGDVVAYVDNVTDEQVDALFEEYQNDYDLSRISDDTVKAVKDAARIEIGLETFLLEGGFKAFTTTFENLHGLCQLPGLAVQRLMSKGYGFGAEGDWKTAAMVRTMKVIGAGLEGGTSFMEDYTYHLNPADPKVLGSHMLEVCPSIADNKPSLEVHPLGIGGKDDPARLVFNSPAGPAINVSVIDLGNRFRMVVNDVDAVEPDADLPNLPVARVVWKPMPDLEVSAAAWIHSGAAHHSGYSQAVTAEHMTDFAEIAGIELVQIDKDTTIPSIKNTLRWNDVFYQLYQRN
jgi:L-arabinose isomerase